jgi:hypothetical protein
VKSFWIGLFVGAALGAGGVYLGLAKPWAGGEEATATVSADAGPELATKGKKRRKRRKRRKKAGSDGVLGDPIVELSAADRKLVWSGQRVALEPRDVDFASGDDGGRPLDQGEINAGISSRSDAVIDCIKEARGNAELSATITLRALVEGTGRVSRSRVRAPKYLVDNGVASCIRREAKSMRFAATGAQTVVSVPFDLR